MIKSELMEIISDDSVDLSAEADRIRNEIYGKRVFFRGLIEFTNYCENDCYYCGIRNSNGNVERYRLSADEILKCCEVGYSLGFRSFVLQGGEDSYYENFDKLIYSIKSRFPDSALTISVGEKSRAEYQKYYDAGADRYLLRHETATDSHYKRLHPRNQILAERKKCLYDLKEIGFQVGAGFMVGSPFQTTENIADDIMFLQELGPHMVGIGPFIPHHDTPFKDFAIDKERILKLTIKLISLTRIVLPKSLLPATTAVASIDDNGREKAILAGANVVMPNLSPYENRALYSLYDNKAFSGLEAAESLMILADRIKSIGFEPSFTRGDHADYRKEQ